MPDPVHLDGERETTVFFSYSRTDQKQAEAVIGLLEQAGFSVWWDGLLGGGERFANSTQAALDRARAVVVLWSEKSVGSHWVHDEATRGRDTGRLVPLSLDGTDPPLGFGQFQCIDISQAKFNASDGTMQKVLQAVSVLHGEPDLQPDFPIATKQDGDAALLSRRSIVYGGGLLAIAAAGVAAWQFIPSSETDRASAVAVLPFTNLSGDAEQGYFADGLASEIRSQLSRNPLLQVTGQTSSNEFRGDRSGAIEIARKLGVSFLLDGNVQKAGDRIKITADLSDGRDGSTIWSDSFERSVADIFALQSEIAITVATALSAAMDPATFDESEKQAGGTESVAAFDAYLRGRDLFELHIDDDSYRKALGKFDEAIAIDPNYAAAWAFRSRTSAIIGNQSTQADQRKSLYDDAVRDARRAIDIAPTYAPGYSALGYALFYGRLDVKGAREPYDTGYSLANNDVDVFSRYAIYCARTGRFAEADMAIRRASVLDPLNPSMFKSAGNIKYAAKQYEEAIELGRKALKLNPQRSTVHGDIGNAYLQLGDLRKAAAEFQAEPNSLISLPGQAILADKQGNSDEATRLLDAFVSEYGSNGLYQQAQILAQWGNVDEAFEALAQAEALGDSGLVYLLNDPFLDPLRGDKRFNDLLLKVGFI